jgi:DNA replication ATP-dependent helicase Dna2
MNRGINRFPGKNFYGGRLEPAGDVAEASFPYVAGGPFDRVFDPRLPAVIARVDHEGFRTRSEPEARAVVDLAADALLRQGRDPGSMAVVSPFRAQLRAIVTLLRRELSGAGTSAPGMPVVDTVERIQGQERELIVVSLTASDPEHLSGRTAEFFFSPNRLNVTLTRARTKLIVVCSRHLFRAVPRDLEQLRKADLFRRLFRELPHVDLSGEYLQATPSARRDEPVPRR